jgi:hypothetical protein
MKAKNAPSAPGKLTLLVSERETAVAGAANAIDGVKRTSSKVIKKRWIFFIKAPLSCNVEAIINQNMGKEYQLWSSKLFVMFFVI